MGLKIHRVAHFLWQLKIPIVPRLLYTLNRVLFSVVLPPSVVVGRNVTLGYCGLGTVIHARTVIGNDVVIGTNVTIGGKTPHYAVPIIEDGVRIGAGAKIIGPVRVGRNAVIGANAVVVKNVPSDVTVGGIPAVIIGASKKKAVLLPLVDKVRREDTKLRNSV